MGPIGETGATGDVGSNKGAGWLSAEVFWAELERCGVILTEKYTANGKSRFCTKKDGEYFLVSVHKIYPKSMVDKVLKENGFFRLPLYNN